MKFKCFIWPLTLIADICDNLPLTSVTYVTFYTKLQIMTLWIAYKNEPCSPATGRETWLLFSSSAYITAALLNLYIWCLAYIYTIAVRDILHQESHTRVHISLTLERILFPISIS